MNTFLGGHMVPQNRQSAESMISVASGPRRMLYLAGAGLFFALGIAGVLLPGLPTTPFLLLTSYCLLRSWPSLNERLCNSRFLGPILRDWHERRGVRRRVKIRAIALVVALLAASIIWGGLPVPWIAAVIALGGVGLAVIAWLPTVSEARRPSTVDVAAATDPAD